MKTRRLILLILLAFVIPYNFQVYTQWTSAMGANKPISKQAVQGKIIWNKYNCISCHQIYGLGGFMGPDLTNVISKKSREYAYTFIKSGTAKMPNLKLKETEIQSVLEYLALVDQSGIYPVKEFETHWYGTIKSKVK